MKSNSAITASRRPRSRADTRGRDGASAPTPASLGCGGPRGRPAGSRTTGVESDAQTAPGLGGGRCVRHATAATGRRRRRGTGAARGAAWASGLGWRRRSWGGWSSQASNAAARQRVRRPSPRPRDRPRSRRCSGPARAAMICRPRPWDGQRVAPVVPPAGTVDRGDGAERRVGGHWSRLRGQSVRLPPWPVRPWFAERRVGAGAA